MSPTSTNVIDLLGRLEPFVCLTPGERDEAASAMTTAVFGAREMIIERFSSPRFLFIVSEGVVEERDSGGAIGRYAAGEIFDIKAVLEGRSETAFAATAACTCRRLPAAILAELMRRNRTFRDRIQQAVAQKVDALIAAQQRREAGAFLLSRIGDGTVQAAVFVAEDMAIGEVAALMAAKNTSSVIVRRDGKDGIFTNRDVREKLELMKLSPETPVGEVASYNLITLRRDDYLFDALVTMTRHAIRHLVIAEGGEIVGVFEQADLLRWLTTSSYAIAHQVERAETEADLIEAGAAIPQLIRSLHERGVRPRYIARMVTDLNRKIFNRLYGQILPAERQDGACLVVMGSEGRGEQLIRTDQDNAILFREPVAWEQIEAPLKQFTESLITLGYPPCAGNVMVCNPAWAKSVAEFKREIRRWIDANDLTGLMNLAIFVDAVAVAGDPSLLDDVKGYALDQLRSGATHFGYFAKPALDFPAPFGLFNRLRTERAAPHKGQLELKKAGVFPLVHGIRTLAVEQGIADTNTVARIQRLRAVGVLTDAFSADLIEAFDFMSMLRLRAQLSALDRGQPVDNYIDPGALNKLDRDLLKLSLQMVEELKGFLKSHYKMHMIQ